MSDRTRFRMRSQSELILPVMARRMMHFWHDAGIVLDAARTVAQESLRLLATPGNRTQASLQDNRRHRP